MRGAVAAARDAEVARRGAELEVRGWEFVGSRESGQRPIWRFGAAEPGRRDFAVVELDLLDVPDEQGSYVAEVAWHIPLMFDDGLSGVEGYVTTWADFIDLLPTIEAQKPSDPHPFPGRRHYTFLPCWDEQ